MTNICEECGKAIKNHWREVSRDKKSENTYFCNWDCADKYDKKDID